MNNELLFQHMTNDVLTLTAILDARNEGRLDEYLKEYGLTEAEFEATLPQYFKQELSDEELANITGGAANSMDMCMEFFNQYNVWPSSCGGS